MRKKTGIYKSETDKVQPWRAWLNGKLIWCSRTEREAKQKLAQEKALGK